MSIDISLSTARVTRVHVLALIILAYALSPLDLIPDPIRSRFSGISTTSF